MPDPTDNVVLNFLKRYHSCVQSRCWVLCTLNTTHPVHNFQDAWNYCIEPGWMMWAMARLGFYLDDRVSNFAFGEVKSVYGLLTDGRSQDAFALLKSYLAGIPAMDLDYALSEARAVLTDPPGTTSFSAGVRAAAALVEAIRCADRRNTIFQRIEAADRATSLALEARLWPTAAGAAAWKAFWKKWREQRTSLQADSVRGWIDLSDPAVQSLIMRLDQANQKPPPSSTDTVCPEHPGIRRDIDGGSIAYPTGPLWNSSSTQSGTFWEAYGNDDSPPVSRSAVAVGSQSGSHAGSSIAPTNGYQWAYQFSGLIVGETASLTVTWTEQGGSQTSHNDPNLTVADSI